MLPSSVLKGVDSKNRSRKSAYSKAELLELQDFAEDRGVQIIPEIDMPGHSSLLVEFQPEVFGMEGSPSRSCVNFGSETVRTKLKLLLAEVASLFPHSPYIHLGGDEAWFPDAEKNAGVAERISRLGAGADSHTVLIFWVKWLRKLFGKKRFPLFGRASGSLSLRRDDYQSRLWLLLGREPTILLMNWLKMGIR
jgi:hexosaminidase